jgi:dolichol-phosphate mannosyltransferase
MNEAIRPGSDAPPQAAVAPQLSVVVPTFNERDNVTTLFRRLETALAGAAWEVIFVDDNSPDGTWDVVRGLARQDSASAVSGGSGGEACPGPASRAFWHRARPVRP